MRREALQWKEASVARAYLGSESENVVLPFHVDQRTYCHFNTILLLLLLLLFPPKRFRVVVVRQLCGAATTFVGYSFEFIFEGLLRTHEFRFILPLTRYFCTQFGSTLTARMCSTRHINTTTDVFMLCTRDQSSVSVYHCNALVLLLLQINS